jgi:hypothetical protein
VAMAGAAKPESIAPARVVVRNDTYSSLLISVVEESGRETAIGQAPPEFSNTLLVREPLPQGTVRLVARLVGERAVLYRSEAVRLRPGGEVRWRLPDNRIDG